MPFQSQAQRRWMYAEKPDMAKEWESDTPKGKKLPQYKGKPTLHGRIKQGMKKAFPK